MQDSKKLHIELFPEEYDFMFDSILDAKERAKGINPMNSRYQEEVNKKRKLFGVPALSVAGNPVDDSTMKICINEIEARSKNQKTKYSNLIEQTHLKKL
jgi:hypothetical protein